MTPETETPETPSRRKPLVALVGRPNVGKSTLYNALTRSRDSLVSDIPGLTRDRNYGEAKLADLPCRIVDTGGLLREEEDQIDRRVDKQARAAVEEADIVVFVVDGRDGLTAVDETIAAEHRRGLQQLTQRIVTRLLETPDAALFGEEDEAENQEEGIALAVIGRPNAGKSTLLNRLIGEERLVASPVAGTTRDAIAIPYEDAQGDRFTLIDTAGIRRKARVNDKIEKFSIVKTLDAIERANVVILMLDAHEGVSEQDAHLLGEITRRGRALIIAINKWDHLNDEQRQAIRSQFERKLHFVDYAEVFYISALHGSNIRQLLPAVKKVYRAAMAELSTNKLTEALQAAYRRHQPPLVQGYSIKLQYAHQGGRNPPHIIIHGTRTTNVPASYTTYLSKFFREHFKLHGTPVRISYRDKTNPYADK